MRQYMEIGKYYMWKGFRIKVVEDIAGQMCSLCLFSAPENTEWCAFAACSRLTRRDHKNVHFERLGAYRKKKGETER